MNQSILILELFRDTSIVNTVCLGFFEECGRLFHHRDTEFVAGGDIIDRGSTVSKSNK